MSISFRSSSKRSSLALCIIQAARGAMESRLLTRRLATLISGAVCYYLHCTTVVLD